MECLGGDIREIVDSKPKIQLCLIFLNGAEALFQDIPEMIIKASIAIGSSSWDPLVLGSIAIGILNIIAQIWVVTQFRATTHEDLHPHDSRQDIEIQSGHIVHE